MKSPVLVSSCNSFRTAIVRKTLPLPTRQVLKIYTFLTDVEFCKKHDVSILDYGCGKCQSINPSHWDNYDPFYAPHGLKKNKTYNMILCNYVLCTLPSELHNSILIDIQKRLKKNGIAFISVRNDKPKQGWGISKRGTYQGRCTKLTLPIHYQSSLFRIYYLTPFNILLS